MQMQERKRLTQVESSSRGEVCDVVKQSLRDCGINQLKDITCESQGQIIILRGRVDSFYLKQLAQEIVKKLVPKIQISNLVIVL